LVPKEIRRRRWRSSTKQKCRIKKKQSMDSFIVGFVPKKDVERLKKPAKAVKL